jgi:MtN3 and saliva related transmembrane protein
MPLTDPHVNLTMNIFLIIGNVINLIQNLPQVIKTYQTKSTRDFSSIFLGLRIVGNVIWIVYAIQISSILLIVNNSVTVLATVFISFYKVREIIDDRRLETYKELQQMENSNDNEDDVKLHVISFN